MFTIWFSTEIYSHEMIQVNTPHLDVARRIWDALEATSFYMRSKRP